MKYVLILSVVLSSLWLVACSHHLPIQKEYDTYTEFYHDATLGNAAYFMPAERIETGILAEEEAVQMAVARDPRLPVAMAEIEVSRERLRQAGKRIDPELRWGIDRTSRGVASNDGSYYGADAGLRIFPVSSGFRNLYRAEADASLNVANSSRELIARQVEHDVRMIYGRAQAVEAELPFVLRLADLEEQRLSILKQRFEHGQATQLEILRAEAELLNAKRDVNTLMREQDRLRRNLSLTVGLQEIPDITPLTECNALERYKVVNQPIESQHPEIDIAKWQLRGADVSVQIERAKLLPRFSFIQFGYGTDDRSAANREWSISAGVNIPIFSRMLRTDRQAIEERELARLRLAGIRIDLKREIEEARSDFLAALKSYEYDIEEYKPLLISLEDMLETIREEDDVEQLEIYRLERLLVNIEYSLMRSLIEVQYQRRVLEGLLESLQ